LGKKTDNKKSRETVPLRVCSCPQEQSWSGGQQPAYRPLHQQKLGLEGLQQQRLDGLQQQRLEGLQQQRLDGLQQQRLEGLQQQRLEGLHQAFGWQNYRLR